MKSSYGITNLVAHATTSAAELSREDFVEGGCLLERKIKRFCPQVIALLWISTYWLAFG